MSPGNLIEVIDGWEALRLKMGDYVPSIDVYGA
jgi:hypothetical protein